MKKILLLIIIIAAIYLGFNYLNNQRSEQAVQTQEQGQELQENNGDENEVIQEQEAEDYSVPENAYVVDTESSSIVWTGAKPGVDHQGTVVFKNGYFTEEYTGEFIVQMSSISSEIDNLNDHLKSQDFFDIINFPEARFSAYSYEDGLLFGELDILGITKQVEIPAEISVDGDQLSLEANYTLDRTSFGITFGSGSILENLGDNIIDDEVDLVISVSARR